MKTRWLVIALCGLFAAAQTLAQQAESDRHAETRKLLKLAGAADQFKVAMDVMTAKLAPMIASQIRAGFQKDYPDLDPRAYDAIAAAVLDESRKSFTDEAVVDIVIPVFEKHFTPEEIRELIRFYESPIGAKLASTQPALMTEAVEAGAKLSREATARMQSPEFRRKVYLIVQQFKSSNPEKQESHRLAVQAALGIVDNEPMALNPKGFEKPPSGQVRMSGALAMHLPVRRPACPDPSPQGHQARIQGIVRVEAVIGKDGHVTDEKLISGHPLLVPQAEQCIKQWVFRPMTLNGEPVEVVTELELTFPLAK
ncbi:MAG: DUF2059 domain-containing protein [Bryobacteraceae bacterium]